MNKNIHTLEQLEQEKKKLDLMMEVTKDALVKSLKNNKKELTNFMVKKVVLPAGAIGLGAVAVQKLMSSSSEKEASVKKTESSDESAFSLKSMLTIVFPILIKLVQAYFMKKQNEQIIENKQKIEKVPLRQVS